VWDLGHGIEPIARAIGASALAFVAARYAIFAEGGTEATLLPSLLREANGLDRLEYQVLPGLAEASEAVLSMVSLDAVHLAYLLDSDDAGRRKERYLIQRGVDVRHICVVGRRWAGATIEDLLVRAKYVSALQAELTDRHKMQFDAAARLPELGRAAYVDSWAKKRGISVSHAAVASRLLDEEKPLVQRNRITWLQRMHREIQTALAIGVVEESGGSRSA
jgi:predicted ATP-dependent endonuclease of OLD family